MKTLIRLLALVAALSVGWAANAQSSLAGYEFVTGTASGKWVTLTSTTNLLTSSGDGVRSTVQNIGFSFPFGGSTYTQFSVNSDGNLRLGGTQTGTGCYSLPFSSGIANENNPKINFFGDDGYCVVGTHYVNAQNFTSSNGLKYLVVEFCLGTYASATRNVQYKWQVQLCQNGNIQVVFPSVVPSLGPAVARQMGLCVDNQDGWIIDTLSQATHFTNGSYTYWPSGRWPNANKYYIFYRNNCTTIPDYDYALSTSIIWNTHSSATDPLNAYCHKKVYRVHVDPGFTYTFKTGCGDGATADFDTKLYLYNSSGTELASNDDGCTGALSKIEYYSNRAEYLYLVVRGYNQYSTGSYTLAHKMEFNPSYYSITPTTSYQTHSFTTSSTTPSKIYRFYVSSDDVSNHSTFIFKTTCGDGASASFDTYMNIRDANGTQLTSNDDGACGNTGSYIAYQPTQSGYLYLTVRGYGTSTGSYTLAYKKGCVNLPDYHYPITAYNSWSTHSSQTSSGSCTDYKIYKTWMDAGYAYTFKTGCDDGATADFDTQLELYDSDGTRIAFVDGGCESSRSKLVYLPAQSGYMYLKVKGYSSYVGSYTLAYKRETAPLITANANPTTGGWIDGNDGYYENGQYCYLFAWPSPGYKFTNWTEGSTVVSTDYNYSFTVTSNRTLTANFTPLGNCQIYQDENSFGYIYYDRFDHYTTSTTAKTGVEPPCWALVPLDVTITNAYKPMIYYSPARAHSGNYSLILNKRCIYAMPYVKNVNRCFLTFYVKQSQAKYQLEVGVMSDLNDASTFVPVRTINNIDTGSYQNYNVSFLNPNIQGHYIAFRNTLAEGYTGDFSINYIDDINLEDWGCPGISFPYIDHFDRYTTSTTAKTGEEPPCWELVKQDVTMTDEYKPMVYYSSANAHSGNYSLLLNKRGIYRMPIYDGTNINGLQLDFYLKQTQTKYQLQVGVCDQDGSNFTPVATINNSTTNYEHVTVNFSSYTGTSRYIAFRNILAPGQTGDYSINYIDDLVLSYRFPCPEITPADLPYTDNFDSYTTSHTAKTGEEPPCWSLRKQDVTMTDEYKPMIYYASANAHSGNYSLILNKRGIYAMPHYTGNVNSLQLSFYLKQTQSKYQLQVGVCNYWDGFVPVATINNSSTNYEQVTVDFASYTGHYIAFRNILASGQTGDYSINYIDDLVLSLRPSCTAITADDLPYTDNFDSYTSSTTAKTGVQPDCWTLAKQDVTMTDEYKPMIYYASANAHSGNYSLLLNKRGIYAMPEYSGNVKNLQLRMYLKQPQTKYQLQVGVMTDLSNPNSFTVVKTINNSSTSHVQVTVNFSSYTGSGHYIAFRNVLASGQTGDYSLNYIDDITLSTVTNYTITATAYPSAGGSVSGAGTFASGSTCTLRATPASGYTFTNWTSGSTVVSTNATYSFTVTANRTLKANFSPVANCGIAVADLPYTDNFDSYTTSHTPKTGVQPDCWTLAKQDVTMTDEYKPMIYYASDNAHSGNYSLILNKRGIYAMPEFNGNVNTLQLSMYLKQPQTKYQLQVGVMTSLSNPSSFTPVATLDNSGTGHVLRTVNFSSYTGSGHYIAFRNILASGQTGDYSLNYIDDLTLSVNTPSCTLHVADLPYTDNYDSYTTSTAAKTGVEPPCWTLAYQDVTMTNEYKPMVYYGSATAHSGNYSLILNKRGIYAMPYFDGSVKNLQLSMYLKQSQTKYQLQVGVMTSLSNPSSFVTVATLNNSGTGYVHRTVDFSSYTGSGHYIAFRNVLASGQTGDYSCNYIDDLRLETRCSIYPDELPFTDNFDSYTSSTTAKTGVQPDCWTLAHQDVTMTNEYKPMIYYGSSTAYSGNYSLILNKRGIYAMPRFTGNVNSLQLSFYLKQTQTKYQLQVGVMSSLSDASTFVPVATFNNTSTTSFVLRTVNFSSYTGSGHYIAFRNILASGQTGDYSCNYIDNINVRTASKGDMPDDGYGMEATAHSLTLYPNPTTGILNVEADEEVVRVDVFDYTGRCVASFERQTTVDLGRLATGLYTLRVTLPERIEVRRVVKQ